MRELKEPKVLLYIVCLQLNEILSYVNLLASAIDGGTFKVTDIFGRISLIIFTFFYLNFQ